LHTTQVIFIFAQRRMTVQQQFGAE